MRVRAIALAVLVALLVPSAAGAATRQLPANDSFYRYAGSRALGSIPPGTVLKQRSIRVAIGLDNPTPMAAEQLLYRTTDQLGRAAVTVTTVLRPRSSSTLPRIVGYLSFYDGLGSQCDPSFTLAGGDAGDSTYQQEADEEELLMAWYLSQGDVVTVPDFEGTGLHWMAGRESGQATLDALRATESYLRRGLSTKVGLSGYSGGAVAADWASELASAYAPELNIVGVAMGDFPPNYFHHIAYINGTGEYSAAIPAELLGLSRAYDVDLRKYLTDYGRKVVNEESAVCIASAFGRYPGLTVDKILLPPYRDLAHATPFAGMLGDQTMGVGKTHPRMPLLIGTGNADGTGDGAMVAADVKALALRYCSQGVAIEYQEYPGASHVAAGAFFDPQTGPFLQSRFAGAPPANNCSSIS